MVEECSSQQTAASTSLLLRRRCHLDLEHAAGLDVEEMCVADGQAMGRFFL